VLGLLAWQLAVLLGCTLQVSTAGTLTLKVVLGSAGQL